MNIELEIINTFAIPIVCSLVASTFYSIIQEEVLKRQGIERRCTYNKRVCKKAEQIKKELESYGDEFDVNQFHADFYFRTASLSEDALFFLTEELNHCDPLNYKINTDPDKGIVAETDK